jgi:hypothetical protein
MPLSDDQRKILEAMLRLPNRSSPAAEIAAEADAPAVTIGRDLREMEASLNPRPVQSELNASSGEDFWFLTPAADDYLGEQTKLINVQRLKRGEDGTAIAIVVDGYGGTEELPLNADNAIRVEAAFEQNKLDLDRYANQPDEFPTPASIPVEIVEDD